MFNKLLRPLINKRRNSSANASKKSYIALAAMLFAGFGVQAQQTLPTTAMTPDHAAIQANKISAPGALTVPTSPMTPDPMISLLPPGTNTNAAYWNQMRRIRAQAAKSGSGSSTGPITYTEREGDEGANDTPGTAERIRNFGTSRRERNEATITGSLPGPTIRTLNQMEDDGAIPLSNQTGITAGPDAVTYSGVIGDGPLAGTVSDYDMYAATIPAGTTFSIAVETPEPFGDLDPFVSIYLPNGALIFQQDDGGDGFDTFVTLTVGANDLDLIFAIGGFGAFEPADPFNSTGGSITGAIGSEGTYDFTIRVLGGGAGPVDFYEFHLSKGDVFGAAVRTSEGSPVLQIFSRDEGFEKGAQGFGSFGVVTSPLPVNRNGVIDYVVEKSGAYQIGVSGGFGAYEMDLGVYRPQFEIAKPAVQVVWLDYNGGPVDKQPWFGIPFVTDHTPFRDFLPAWGLPDGNNDIRRITNKITSDVRDNLYTELDDTRENRNLGIVLLGNDGTGTPDLLEPLMDAGTFSILGLTFEVSVVEVSGTIPEANISTIGIASTIDPGNYAVNDAALVLLDILSAPASGGNANGSFSLNDVVLAPGVAKEDMVATVLSNVIAHEAGHYLGNFHTDGFTVQQSLMDQGPGGLFNLAGIGPSGVYGAADQTDVAFVTDLYAVSEGFQGDENTTVNTAYALSYFPSWFRLADEGMPTELAAQLAPEEFASQTLLNQSIPNSLDLSLNPTATIRFSVEENSSAMIRLYDLAGNEIGTIFKGEVKGGESKVVTLDANKFNLKPGVYIYKLDTPSGSKNRKIVVR